jgi:preprotein translocase subunit SecE
VAVRSPRRGVPAPRPTRSVRPVRPVRIDIRYLREIVSELRKVTWPSRETAINLTVVVTVVSIAVGLILGGFDYAFSWLVNTVLIPK